MRRGVGFLVLASVFVALVAGCGSTPEPTVPPPTQTPWIVIITSTPRPEPIAQVLPTQVSQTTPPALTRTREATPVPTTGATIRPGTPGATVEPTESSASPAPTEEAPAPTATDTSEAMELKYPAPILLEPPRNRPVSWKSTVLLIWTSVGELAEDEYYCVQFERPPKTTAEEWYGDYVYTQETSYLAEGPFLAPFHLPEVQGQAVVYWWVRVVRKTGEDEYGKPIGIDLSLPSQDWTLILDPKPEGQ